MSHKPNRRFLRRHVQLRLCVLTGHTHPRVPQKSHGIRATSPHPAGKELRQFTVRRLYETSPVRDTRRFMSFSEVDCTECPKSSDLQPHRRARPSVIGYGSVTGSRVAEPVDSVHYPNSFVNGANAHASCVDVPTLLPIGLRHSDITADPNRSSYKWARDRHVQCRGEQPGEEGGGVGRRARDLPRHRGGGMPSPNTVSTASTGPRR